MSGYVDVVFDGPPSHESGRFVECENEHGEGISAGEWIDCGDLWRLRIPSDAALRAENRTLLEQLEAAKIKVTKEKKRLGDFASKIIEAIDPDRVASLCESRECAGCDGEKHFVCDDYLARARKCVVDLVAELDAGRRERDEFQKVAEAQGKELHAVQELMQTASADIRRLARERVEAQKAAALATREVEKMGLRRDYWLNEAVEKWALIVDAALNAEPQGRTLAWYGVLDKCRQLGFVRNENKSALEDVIEFIVGMHNELEAARRERAAEVMSAE